MKIHEYQAKLILSDYGVRVPRGGMASNGAEAGRIAHDLGGSVVVKAQIHAGGRGKGGGVRRAGSADEVEKIASEMIGMRLVTHQTGPEGRIVRRVLVEEVLEVERELYLGVVIDRSARRPVVMASSSGGVSIEGVAAERPESILKEHVHPSLGVQPFQARRLAFGLGFDRSLINDVVSLILALYRVFEDNDASLAEINPFVVTRAGRVCALDAKMSLDDNALDRHEDLAKLRDLNEEEPLEIEAVRHGLSYIKLDGNIGCMVNGAGLAMATMDIIKLAGGTPANFLDVGGGASSEQVTHAFRILLSDAKVRAILINIFGGIMRCDVVARGSVAAVRAVGVNVPVVIRLEGTKVEEGRQIIRESGLAFIVADSMKDAADKVVVAVR